MYPKVEVDPDTILILRLYMCNFCPGIKLSKTGGIGGRYISVVVVQERWGDGDTSVEVDVSDINF